MAEDRRDRPGWEPPPWEEGAFEQMRKRREEERADEEISAAVADLQDVPAVSPGMPAPGLGAQREEAPRPPDAVSAARMEALLVGLRAEEPRSGGSAWIAGAISAGVLVVLGLVLLVWGFTMFARTGNVPAGAIGSTIIIAFGGASVALGAWLAQRTLKSKGVI